MPVKKPKFALSLDEVRAEVKAAREQGLRIQSHYKKLEKEYSDWEDRINKLDILLNQAEDEFGLTKKEILTNPTPFGDIILDGIEFDPEESMLEDNNSIG